ncbi:MAG: Crp/Fnr family transcriptional regulator [Sulfitobacter sp.]
MKDTFPFDSDALHGASDALKQVMSQLAVAVDLEPGDVLMEKGDHGDTFYAIHTGSLEFSVISSDGRKLSLDVMHKGAMFGEIALFDPGPRTATVTALKPTRVLGIKNADVIKALHKSPELAIDMLRLAGQRMRWMGVQLSEQVFLPLPARLAKKVLHLTAHTDAEQPDLNLSQAELAEFAGASREAVSKTLSRWNRNGIISLTRGGLRLLDRDALQALAEINEI